MQINTKGPHGRGTGPLPRNSRAPPNASYVGIMECPCTSRIKKVVAGLWARGGGVARSAVPSFPLLVRTSFAEA